MENQESAAASRDPLALASAVLGVVGCAVYCCGSFMCVGWLAFPVWFIGFVLGIAGAVRGTGNDRIIAIIGIALNVLPGLVFAVLTFLGVGLALFNQQ
jgi:hypothetical protein